jgi:hypothetical protein
MDMRKIVYDDEELRVIYQPGHSDFLLVTFGDLISLASEDQFYADRPVTKMGLTCLGFMAKTPNWYPVENMRRAIQAISGLRRGFERLITYG